MIGFDANFYNQTKFKKTHTKKTIKKTKKILKNWKNLKFNNHIK